MICRRCGRPRKGVAAIGAAAALASLGVRAGAEDAPGGRRIAVVVEGCRDAAGSSVRDRIALELGAGGIEDAPTAATPRLAVTCTDHVARLRLDDPIARRSVARALALGDGDDELHARLVALAAAELVVASFREPGPTADATPASTSAPPRANAPTAPSAAGQATPSRAGADAGADVGARPPTAPAAGATSTRGAPATPLGPGATSTRGTPATPLAAGATSTRGAPATPPGPGATSSRAAPATPLARGATSSRAAPATPPGPGATSSRAAPATPPGPGATSSRGAPATLFELRATSTPGSAATRPSPGATDAGAAPATSVAATASPAVRDTGLRLVAGVALQGFLSGPGALWGGAARLSGDHARHLAWGLDAVAVHGGARAALGAVSTDTLSLGATVGAHATLGRLRARAGAGVRLGAARFAGEPSDPRLAAGSTLWGAWAGPLVAVDASVSLGRRLAVELAVEGGYVALPVTARVGPGAAIAVDGPWAGVELGLAVRP